MTCCYACAKHFDAKQCNVMTGIKKIDSQGNAVPVTNVSDICSHTEKERSYICVIGNDELKHALSRGYKVSKVYHGLIWNETDRDDEKMWSTDLFKGTKIYFYFIFFLEYIRDFVKFKVQSSGWPDVCEDNPKEKQKYLDLYRSIDVDLDPGKLDEGVNEGMRFIAKQFLNSLWGVSFHTPLFIYDIYFSAGVSDGTSTNTLS